MNSTTADISCQCGTLQGKIDNISPKSTNHLTCHCKYCSGFAAHLGQADRLVDESGASDLLHVAPWSLHFTAGQNQLKVLKFADKAPLRWYAGCCNTPLGITSAGRFPPFASLVVENIKFPDGGPGPVIFNAFCDHLAEEERPAKAGKMPMLRILGRLIKLWTKGSVTGKWKENPFFDPQTGKPVANPTILTSEQRASAFSALPG